MVKVIKEQEGKWLVWNKKTGKMAEIVAIQDFGYLAKSHKQYRVDVEGKTVETMLDHFQTARSIAVKHVA